MAANVLQSPTRATPEAVGPIVYGYGLTFTGKRPDSVEPVYPHTGALRRAQRYYSALGFPCLSHPHAHQFDTVAAYYEWAQRHGVQP
jgi:hypothetical protein